MREIVCCGTSLRLGVNRLGEGAETTQATEMDVLLDASHIVRHLRTVTISEDKASSTLNVNHSQLVENKKSNAPAHKSTGFWHCFITLLARHIIEHCCYLAL